jgi:hypothetical protein
MIISYQAESEYLKKSNKALLDEKLYIEKEFGNWKMNINKELELTKTENKIFRQEHESMLGMSLEKNKELESLLLLKDNEIKECIKINNNISCELEKCKN